MYDNRTISRLTAIQTIEIPDVGKPQTLAHNDAKQAQWRLGVVNKNSFVRSFIVSQSSDVPRLLIHPDSPSDILILLVLLVPITLETEFNA